ncbi:MAG: hypothetical protein GC154_02955 [bacterium]|nr:hypothetical protein [bacterium]
MESNALNQSQSDSAQSPRRLGRRAIQTGLRRGLFAAPVLLALYFEWRFYSKAHGLPLDDGYIYLQYVKNLAAGQGLSFNPGEISFGVTSFLYAVLCGFLHSVTPFWDAITAMQVAGAGAHLALVILIQCVVYAETRNLTLASFCGWGVAACRAFYFTGPAGLETTLFHFMTLASFGGLLMTRLHPAWRGLLCGLLYLTRPEGLLVACGYLFFLLTSPFIIRPAGGERGWKPLLIHAAYFVAAFLMVVLPYELYVYYHSGLWLPTTFYGKLLSHNDFTGWPIGKKIREGFFSMTKGYEAVIYQDPTQASYCILLALSVFSLLLFCFRCGSSAIDPRRFAARTVMFSFFLLPVMYGAAFHTSAQFGGYAARYVQVLIVLFFVEGAFALSALIDWAARWIATPSRRCWARNLAALAFAAPMLYVIMTTVFERLPYDLDYHHFNVVERQGVRMQAARWLRENTPESARLLLGSTGLGVIGAYSERYCKDEGGLINPDIFPYLQNFSDFAPHWFNMMEYMKAERLTYYTTYVKNMIHNPITHPTRFTTLAGRVFDQKLLDDPVNDEVGEIRIFRFEAPELYDLWDDTAHYMRALDRNPEAPVIEGRIVQTEWNGRRVVALSGREAHYLEAQYDLIMPTNARLSASLAIDVPERDYGAGEWVRFNMYVDRHNQREVVFSETFDVRDLPRREPFKRVELDLSRYSGQYVTFCLAAGTALMPEPGPYWMGWIDPRLDSADDVQP